MLLEMLSLPLSRRRPPSPISTGGKSAAFLLPILNRLIGKKRGTTRALILTPTRELAAQIDEHLRELAIHTPLSGAAIYGGVGMGPQEHAFRSGADVIVFFLYPFVGFECFDGVLVFAAGF